MNQTEYYIGAIPGFSHEYAVADGLATTATPTTTDLIATAPGNRSLGEDTPYQYEPMDARAEDIGFYVRHHPAITKAQRDIESELRAGLDTRAHLPQPPQAPKGLQDVPPSSVPPPREGTGLVPGVRTRAPQRESLTGHRDRLDPSVWHPEPGSAYVTPWELLVGEHTRVNKKGRGST